MLTIQLIACIALFIGFSALVWWTSGLGRVQEILMGKGRPSDSGGQDLQNDNEEQVDPEKSLVLKLALRRAFPVALASAALLMALLLLINREIARSDFESHMNITLDVLHKIGYAEDRNSIKGLINLLGDEAKKGKSSDNWATFIKAFTDTKDVEIISKGVKDRLVDFIHYENRQEPPLSSPAAFARTLVGQEDPPLENAMREYMLSQVLPWFGPPKDASQFFTGMQFVSDGLKTLHDELVNPIQKVGDQDKKDAGPGILVLFSAMYNRIQSKLLNHLRYRSLFVGPIQFMTLTMFFFAIILLHNREHTLKQQKQCMDFFRTVFYDQKAKGLFADPAPGQEWGTNFPKLACSGKENLEKAICVIEDCAKSSEDSHLYAPAVFRRILVELKRGASFPQARDLLRHLTERNEQRLERIEYAPIDFALYAMPSLGFIGTVLGISTALGSANQVVLAADALGQANAITLVTGKLGMAFDTTLIALVCSIGIMWLISRIRSSESKFLLDTQQQINASILGQH